MEPTRTTENTKILIGPILSNSFEKVNQNGVIVVGWSDHDPPGIYLLKVNNRNTRTSCEICSELTIKTLERCQWRRSGVFIVNFEHFHTCSVVSIVNFEHINVAWWTYLLFKKNVILEIKWALWNFIHVNEKLLTWNFCAKNKINKYCWLLKPYRCEQCLPGTCS